MPPKAVKERRERAEQERLAKEAAEKAKLDKEAAKAARKEKIKQQREKKKQRDAAGEDDGEEQPEEEELTGFENEEKKIAALGGKDKKRVSIIVEKKEPPPITELTEEILDTYTAEGMNIYTQKWPIFVDFSHKLWKLNKLDNIDLIHPPAVKEIDLSENALNKIGNEPLNKFDKLRRLRLANNFIRTFELVECTRIVVLDIHRNRLGSVPQLAHMTSLQYLDLSFNKISEGWDRVLACRKLRYLYLNNNLLEMDQDDFNDNILNLRELRALVDLNLSENPFKQNIRQYRQWILTNVGLKRLDGEMVSVEEKKKSSKMKDPPLDIDISESGSEKSEEQVYDGPVCEHRILDMIAVLKDSFERPSIAVRAIQEVEGYIEKQLETPEEGRRLFDVTDRGDKQARVVNLMSVLMEASESAVADGEGVDPRQPFEIVDELVMVIDMMIVRQPMLARKAMSLLAMLLAMPQFEINEKCKAKLMEYLNAGDQYGEVVVDVIRQYLVPRMQGKNTNADERELLLEALNEFATHRTVIEAMRSMTNEISAWLREEHPSVALLGVVANATMDSKVAHDLREQQVTTRIIQLKQELDSRPDPQKRKAIMLIIGNLSRHDASYAADFRVAKVHNDALQELNNLLSALDFWNEEQASRANALLTCIHGMTLNDKVALEEAQSNGYVERLLLVAERPNLHPQLMAKVLTAITGILAKVESISHITVRLKGVVWLLSYLHGKGYDAMCRQVNALVEGEPVPIDLLDHPDIIAALNAIVRLLTVYHKRARKGDTEALHTVAKLDNAGREEFLFRLLHCADDSVRLTVVDCLNWVPLDNLQPEEIQHLVDMLSAIDNLGVGRTEEVIGGVLGVLSQLVLDKSLVGEEFRSTQVDVVHVVLDILVRNAKRDTRNSRQESEEKAALSDSCIRFLRCCRKWGAALDIMTTRNAVLAMGEILGNEERLGRADRPVMIEKTGVGRGVKALLYALPLLRMDGHVAKRVLLRIAEVLEGIEDSENVENLVVPDKVDLDKEDDEARQWRLTQHAVFLQVDGIEVMLAYLMKNATIRSDLFGTSGVHERFEELLKDEERRSVAILLGEQIHEQADLAVEQDGLLYLLNEDLHHPSLVEFPVVTLGSLLGDRDDKDAAVVGTYANAPAVAAALRVFCALLMHGNSSTRGKAVQKARNLDFVRALVSLAAEITENKWYPSGVGENLLTIFNYLFTIERKRSRESMEIIPLYDIAGQVFRSMLKVIEGKMDRVLRQFAAEGDTEQRIKPEEEAMMQRLAVTMRTMIFALQYIMPSNDMRINEVVQDNLAMDIVAVPVLHGVLRYIYYDHVMTRVTKWEAADVEGADARLHTQVLITEFICEYLHVNDEYRFDILEFFNRMEVQRRISIRTSYLAHMLASVKLRSYLHALERFMLEHNMFPDGFERIVFCRWMVVDTHKDSLVGRSMVQLGFANKPENPLDKFEQQRKGKRPAIGANADQSRVNPSALPAFKLDGEDDENGADGAQKDVGAPVGASLAGWVRSRLGVAGDGGGDDGRNTRPRYLGSTNFNMRLLVVSNMGLYIFAPPPGKACNLCDPSEFCPNGPSLLARKEFRVTKSVVLHPSKQRARVWFAGKDAEGKQETRVVTYKCMEANVMEPFVSLLVEYFPLQNAADKPVVFEDKYTQGIIERNLVGSEEGKEEVLGTLVCWEGNFDSPQDHGNGKAHAAHDRSQFERVLVITGRRIYFFQEDLSWWLVRSHEDSYLHLLTTQSIASITNVRFSSSSVPSVNLEFKDETQTVLTFACDPGRELFRVLMKKAVSGQGFVRSFEEAKGGNQEAGQPEAAQG